MTPAPGQETGRACLPESADPADTARQVSWNGHEHDGGCWWDHRGARWVYGSSRRADPRDHDPDETGALA